MATDKNPQFWLQAEANVYQTIKHQTSPENIRLSLINHERLKNIYVFIYNKIDSI